MFVVKLAPDGKSLVYSTYLGALALGTRRWRSTPAGAAYVTGRSPGRASRPPPAPTRRPSAGSRTRSSRSSPQRPEPRLLDLPPGGGGQDNGEAIAVDSAGSAYVTGFADSTDFPTTASAFQTTPGGGRDVFVTKLAPDGATPDYSTYLGGTGDEDVAVGIAVDSGSAYITGRPTSADFPTHNALDTTRGGTQDAYVTKLAPNGQSLAYSTYLGGSGDDQAFGSRSTRRTRPT